MIPKSRSRTSGALVLAVVLVLEVLAAVIVVAQATGGTKMYYKVNPSFPSDLNTNCLLLTTTHSLNLNCASLCNAKTNCRLFCTDGECAFRVARDSGNDGTPVSNVVGSLRTECQLFSAKVTLHWAGDENLSAASRHCYSSYANPNNIAHTATISASPPKTEHVVANFAVIGFNCHKGNFYQYTSNSEVSAWWAADLGEPRAISSVVIGSKQWNPTDFEDIEIRVGFVSGAGDFSANPLLDTYAGPAEPKQVLVFRANVPLVGSVVSVQRMSVGALTINSVQIIAD